MEQITLYYRSGASDKVYQASIQPTEGDKYTVQFAFGRRGATLQTGNKTPTAVSYDAAKALYDKLISEKQGKGYTVGETGTPYQHTNNEPLVTGIQCQLLNPIGDDEIGPLILHPEWWLQEKFDGRRLLIQKSGEEIIGINRRGLRVALPETLAQDAMLLPMDCLIDGEAIGEQLHVFDILRLDGEDLRPRPYLERFLRLMRTISSTECRHITVVRSACTDGEKQKMFDELKANKAEGVVFKHITEPYTSGRPASGGPALKHKFVKTASFVVSKVNGKRSVLLMLFDGDKVKPAGNVTIPANHRIPEVGKVVEIQYLYALKESGSIYQPVYLGQRDDITSEECTVDQLQWKPPLREPLLES